MCGWSQGPCARHAPLAHPDALIVASTPHAQPSRSMRLHDSLPPTQCRAFETMPRSALQPLRELRSLARRASRTADWRRGRSTRARAGPRYRAKRWRAPELNCARGRSPGGRIAGRNAAPFSRNLIGKLCRGGGLNMNSSSCLIGRCLAALQWALTRAACPSCYRVA